MRYSRLKSLIFLFPLALSGYLLGTYALRLDVAAERTHRSACTSLGLEPVNLPMSPAQLQLTTLQGDPFPLAKLQGRFVILNFWLTTCAPCLQELPSLVELGRRYQGHGLAMLLVVTDKDLGGIQTFIREMPRLRTLPPNVVLLHDPGGRLAKRLGTVQFPETYLISTSGRWLGRVIGDRDWTSRIATSCVFPRLP